MRLNSIYVLGLIILIALTQCKKSQNTENKPNFIVFIADDVSWDDLSVYGNEYVKTPNIESLSSEGLVFKNMYLTTSSCSPSRNSIITGRYPHNTGAPELHSQPPLEMTTVVEALKEGGYYTALSGKFHMGDYARRGFDLINEDKKINGPGGEEQWVKTLEDRPKDQPFFMWYASYDAHRSWGENDFSGTHDPEALTPPEYLVNDYPTKQDLGNYYDEIRRFDHSIGEVVATLKKQTVYENTFIIVMSDNGRPFPHSKTRLNDQGVKTPFILTYKKDKISGETQSLISAIDIAPTILEYAKLEIGENYQGKSFKKVLENPDTPFRNYVFAEHNWHDYEAHERMVRSKDFMYIENNRNQFAQRGPLDAINSDSYASLLAQLQTGEISEIQKEIFLSPRPKREVL
jgi:arylsulfatase A-like enzyme